MGAIVPDFFGRSLALFLPWVRSMSQHEPVPVGIKSLLIDDAAQLLGVSRRTIYYRIREGRLQTIYTRCGSQRVLLSSIEMLRGAGEAVDVGRELRPELGVIRDQDAGV